MNQTQISQTVKSVQEEAIDVRRTIHRHPELGFEEEQTSSLVSDKLREWEIPHESNIAETGVVGFVEGEENGPTIMLRADMDALPIQEEADVPYKSTRDGVMHACGHDAHTSILLHTAKILAENRDQLNGNVKLIFQPAEEGPGGAKPMIEEGVLESPEVEAAFGLHLWNPLPVGNLGIQSGPLMACADRFQVTVQGKGGHGARPHEAVDPVACSSQIISTLQSIASRETDPVGTVVISVGKIEGGSRFNVIPDEVFFEGTVRTFDEEYRKTIPERIERICDQVAAAYRCEANLNYIDLYPPTINDRKMTDLVRKTAQDVVDPEHIHQNCQTLGGEDMSFFLNEVPGCYFFVGSGLPDEDHIPHHRSDFKIDERAIPVGIEMMKNVVFSYFQNQ